MLAATDATFDLVYFTVALIFSDGDDFANEMWWVASLGVAIPLVGTALVARDIAQAARNAVLSEEWLRNFRTARPRRKSIMAAAASGSKTCQQQHRRTISHAHHHGNHHTAAGSHRAAVVLSFVISAYSVACGGVLSLIHI